VEDRVPAGVGQSFPESEALPSAANLFLIFPLGSAFLLLLPFPRVRSHDDLLAVAPHLDGILVEKFGRGSGLLQRLLGNDGGDFEGYSNRLPLVELLSEVYQKNPTTQHNRKKWQGQDCTSPTACPPIVGKSSFLAPE